MDTVLKTGGMECCQEIYRGQMCREETGEAVVPDVQPDILRLLDTVCCVTLRSKEVTAGRLTVTGQVQTAVLYQPENGGGEETVELTLPVSFTAEVAEADDDAYPWAELRLLTAEARLLNPRKVLVRLTLCAELGCCRRGHMEWAEPAAETDGPVHLRRETVQMRIPAAFQEKTVEGTQDEELPEHAPAVQRILGIRAETRLEEVKPVGSRFLFRGETAVSCLLRDEDGALGTATVTVPFSQLLDGGDPEAGDVPRVTVMPVGVYGEVLSGGRTISAEVRLAAQAVFYRQTALPLVTDAYSNTLAVTCHSRELSVQAAPRHLTGRAEQRGILPTPTGLRELLYSGALPGQVSRTEQGASVPVTLWAVYRDETGASRRAEQTLSLSVPMETAGEKPRFGTPRITELFLTPVGEGLEYRLSLELPAELETERRFHILTEVETGEKEASADPLPSLTVLPWDGTGTLWDMARTYASTEALIRAANGLEGDDPGPGLLLIPKEREKP